jgi:hypothetical protein
MERDPMASTLHSRRGMQTTPSSIFAVACTALALTAVTATPTPSLAQTSPETAAQVAPSPELRRFFLEGSFGGGLLLGDVDYVPGGTSGDWSYPLVYGWEVGGTAGFMISPNVGFFGTYGYSQNQTREGRLDGLVDRVEGRLEFHTATGGVRLMMPTGFGAFRSDLGLGVIFPHSRVLNYEYAPEISQLGIPVQGLGRRVENYSVGVGFQGRIGYQIPLFGPLYAAADAELQLFQSENSGETTQYENFVDFRAAIPAPINTTVTHGDGAAQPRTASVQSARLLLSVGASF